MALTRFLGHILSRLCRRRCLFVLLVAALLLAAFVLISRTGRRTAIAGNDRWRHTRVELQSPAPLASSAPPFLAIPKRLHHYFGDAIEVSSLLAQAVNSWANNHKDYDVYYWDSRYLEGRVLPGLQIYGKYRSCYRLERHTVGRLLLLLSQGGVLVDPDLMSVRDFAGFLDGSACVLAQERLEVAALAHGLDQLPSLRFAACRPGHPFVRLLLDRFCVAAASVASNGSRVFDDAAALRAAFDAAVSAYDDDCASRECDHRDRVVLADPMVFLPVVKHQLHDRLKAKCTDSDSATLSKLQLAACQSLQASRNQPSMVSLAIPVQPDAAEPALPLSRIRPPTSGRHPIKNWLLPPTV